MWLKISEINGSLKVQIFLEVTSIFLVELFLDHWIKSKLLVESLKDRVKKQNIEEVILATSATVEGQTAYYIEDSLKNINVKISKLAQGLPVGGEIENLDDGTLFSAFKIELNFNFFLYAC